MSRQKFWIAFVIFVILVAASQFGLDKIATTMTGFFLSLVFLFLFFLGLYAIYGKRLHDFGYSVWPITGMLFATCVITIMAMMIFGGAEYFSEFAQYDRKEDIDSAEVERLKTAYQARVSEGGKYLGPILWGLWGLFTLWVGASKSKTGDNKYGSPVN